MTPFEGGSTPAQRLPFLIIASVFLLISVKGILGGVYKDGMHLLTAFSYGWLAFKEPPLRSRAAISFWVILALAAIALLFSTWSMP
jgi:hypothetical protein